MLRNQKCEIGILRLFLRVFVTVSVYRNDAIGIFIYDRPLWIHTEGTHLILVFLGTVNNLALV